MEPTSRFEKLKADPGKSGVENFQAAVEKLRMIRGLELNAAPCQRLPWKVLPILKRRALNETASEMREHPDTIRYGLMGCFLHLRSLEITDEIARMAVDLIHRLDRRSEKQIHKEWPANLERVEGRMQILSRVAEAVVGEPDGVVRHVIFPKVKEETFQNLVTEFRLQSPQLRLLRQSVMQQKVCPSLPAHAAGIAGNLAVSQ